MLNESDAERSLENESALRVRERVIERVPMERVLEPMLTVSVLLLECDVLSDHDDESS